MDNNSSGPRLADSDARVVSVRVEHRALAAAEVPELRELFGLERLPLGMARVSAEIRGVTTDVVNAIRRALVDEMPGRCLAVPAEGGFDSAATTDPFMLPQFVEQRIALIPLRPQIPAATVRGLRLRLDATNPGTEDFPVYAGDLQVAAGEMPEPLFNPTFKLAVLQPGARLVVNGIHIAEGRGGRDGAAFNVARRAAYRHLDLPEHERAETHDEGGAAVDQSGYKVSTLVADPRWHVLSATLPATTADPAEARAVLADACANIAERLRFADAVAGRRAAGPGAEAPAHQPGAQFTVVDLHEGLVEGILQIPGETDTIGGLVCRAIFELAPDIVFTAYTVIPHEGRLAVTVHHAADAAGVTALVRGAIRRCIAVIDVLRAGFERAR